MNRYASAKHPLSHSADLRLAVELDQFSMVAPDFSTGFVGVGSAEDDYRDMDPMNAVMLFPSSQSWEYR